MIKRYHVIFKGRVQKVGFRKKTKQLAEKYNITGNVRNLENGDVEAYLQGEEKLIENLKNKLNNNIFINIQEFEIEEVDIVNNETEFIIID